jgi:hypothetical protein
VEFGVGEEIRALDAGVDSTLLIFMKRGLKILHGTTEENFELTTYSGEISTVSDTVKRLLSTTFFISEQGLTTLDAVAEFGDYSANTISKNFKRTLLSNLSLISATSVSRSLNQYRIFFNNGKALYVSFEGGELLGATPMFFPDPVLVLSSGVDSEGTDLTVFGSSDGYVRKMDSGKTFNGKDITCRLMTTYHSYNSPRNYKLFKRATVEVFGENGQELTVKCLFDYQSPDQPVVGSLYESLSRRAGSAVWGVDPWGSMVWGLILTVTSSVPFYINGLGTNMSYTIVSKEKHRDQHIIQNILTEYELCARRS